MMAMPICDIIVMDKLLVNTQGARTNNTANNAHTRLVERAKEDGVLCSGIAFTQKTTWSENQNQHEEQIGQHGRNLRHRELQHGVVLRIG